MSNLGWIRKLRKIAREPFNSSLPTTFVFEYRIGGIRAREGKSGRSSSLRENDLNAAAAPWSDQLRQIGNRRSSGWPVQIVIQR